MKQLITGLLPPFGALVTPAAAAVRKAQIQERYGPGPCPWAVGGSRPGGPDPEPPMGTKHEGTVFMGLMQGWDRWQLLSPLPGDPVPYA